MQPSTTILAYLVEGEPRNISVKLLENWSLQSKTVLAILVEGHQGNIPMKFE